MTPSQRAVPSGSVWTTCVALAIGLVCAACSDAVTRIPSSPGARFTRADSIARHLMRPSGLTATGSARDVLGSAGSVSIISLSPSSFQGFSQPEVIEGVLAGPVISIHVQGSGAISCTGTYGTIVGYDASGVVVGTEPLHLIDASDCSPTENPDGVTFGAEGTLTVSSGTISRFQILPMSPLEFPVFDLTGHASASYSITLGAGMVGTLGVECGAAVIRAQPVHCVATMSDGSAFTPMHLKSTAGGVTVVDRDIVGAAPMTSYDWAGTAVVSSEVEITATVGQAPVIGTGSFTVNSRIGQAGPWKEPDFFDFPETPPAAQYVPGFPLRADYPGIDVRTDGYAVQEGALGHTFFRYPSEATIAKIGGTGPNQGMRFVRMLAWVAEEGSGGTPGIYLENSLRSTDPFYTRQAGPSPFCAPADMASLASLIGRHEALHWTEARSRAKPLQTQAAIEGLVALPGASTIEDGYAAAKLAYGQAVAAANSQVEHVLLPVQPNAPVCTMRP